MGLFFAADPHKTPPRPKTKATYALEVSPPNPMCSGLALWVLDKNRRTVAQQPWRLQSLVIDRWDWLFEVGSVDGGRKAANPDMIECKRLFEVSVSH